MKLFGWNKKERLFRKFTEAGIEYFFDGDTPPAFPLNSNPSETLSKLLPQGELWSALDALWADDLVENIADKKWLVPYKVYDKIEDTEDDQLYQTLMLPKPEHLKIEAKSSSHVGQSNFKINIEATHPDHGPLRENDPKRTDRVFYLSENRIVPITRSQADLFNTATGMETDLVDTEGRMAYLAATKQAALEAGAVLDSYLKNEDYEFRDDAQLDVIEHRPDEIQLVPQIKGLESFDVNKENLIDEKVPAVLTKSLGGLQRKRMVIAKPLRDRLEQLPKKGIVNGTDVPKLLTQPESIIPDGFDLSLFSERVKGIKTQVYNSRPYIHVGKHHGGWFEGIPGVELEDWSPQSDSDDQPTSDELSGKPPNLSEDTYKELVKRAKASGSEYVMHDGNWVRIDAQQAEKFEKTLEGLERDQGQVRIPAGSILDIYENLDLLEFVDSNVNLSIDSQLPDDLPVIDPPATFKGELYPYQLSGYQWLSRIENHHLGGLLADDMGLGKTIQVIAHLLKLKENGTAGPHLIVVPKTLLDNWQREVQQFSGGELSCCAYGSSYRSVDRSAFDHFDIVITTYDTLRRDQSLLGTVNWNMVVCDEAQYAKNPTTQRTCAIKALKSKHRAALTGTPVENGLIEFWCIMDFVQPGLLGSWADFRKEYERPIIEGDETARDQIIKNLLGKIKGYYLRRLKDQVLDLPEKRTQVRETRLSDHQFDIYQMIVRQAKAGGRGAKLAAISKLLMLCAHPSTAKGFPQDTDMNAVNCPKLKTTLEILETVEARAEKAIIFTDYKIVQRALQDAIRKKFGLWPDIINGEITHNRQQIIDIFSEKEGFNVIILGHQVAGVGLNITSANHVIHYTRPWNPAKENQATDRAHRIRQSKPVTVYYPIIKDGRFKTVEERLDELIRSKAQLARDVLRPTKEMQVKADELFDCIEDASSA